MKMPPFRALSTAIVLAVGLAGCHDDDGGSAGAGGPIDDPAGAAELTGQVVKGITAHAQVRVYAPDGTELASTLSGPDGAYALMLPAGYEGAVKVVVTPSEPPAPPTVMRCDAPSGCGMYGPASADDVNGNGAVDFGEWSPVAPNFMLSAVAYVNSAGIRLVNLTPLSTMAATWAERFPTGLDENSVLAANTQAAAAFGFAVSDLESPLGDIADPLWLGLADEQQIKLALVLATFAELSALYGLDLQSAVDMIAGAFADQDGRLLEASLEPAPTVAMLLTTATSIAGTIQMPDNVNQEAIQSSLNGAIAQLELGRLSDAPEITTARLLAPLGPLGTDIGELLAYIELDPANPVDFVNRQLAYYSWILSEDNLQMLPLAIDVGLYSLIAASELDHATPDSGTTTLALDSSWEVTLDAPNKTLHAVGTRHGQTFDLYVGLPGLMTAIERGMFDFSLSGTIENATSTVTLDGTLTIDATATDFSPLLDPYALLGDDIPENDEQARADMKAALVALMYSATASVDLDGAARMQRNGTTEALAGEVSLDGFIDLGAAEDEVMASLLVHSGRLELPDGSTLYGREGMPVLTINVMRDATLVIDGAGRVLQLPEATAHAEGTLGNARALIDHVRTTLVTQVMAPSIDLTALVTQLFDFDLSQLSLHGEGVIDIPGMPSGRDHQYRARVDNLVVTVFQPHSEAVAMTATLDPDMQAVHLVLGDERWDLMTLVSPTPRLLLLGPDGMYGDLSQEDFYSFLDALALGDLFGALGFEAVASEETPVL